MNKLKTTLTKLIMAAFTFLAFSQTALSEITNNLKTLTIVPNEKVCMVTDMYFGKTQIPVKHGGQTYYGCCENCKETLSKDAKARTATDPISGKSIDKAKAIIAARADNSVVYFENQKTFAKYLDSQKGESQ